MRIPQALVVVIIAVVFIVLAKHFIASDMASRVGLPVVTSKSGLERVLADNTLRCGYYVFPPITYRDDATGELSGFAVDMMSLFAEKTGIKVEWAEEITFGNWTEGLQAGRFDAICTTMWPDTAQGRIALFTRPLFYAAISPLVRADDARFKTLADLNKDNITFVGQDNSMLAALTREAFPNAKINMMPAMMDGPTVMQEVLTRKADAILLDKNALIEYNKRNDTKLKMISADNPVKGQPFVLVTNRKDVDLHLYMDNAVADLMAIGSIDRLLTKWEPAPQTFLRAAAPFATK